MAERPTIRTAELPRLHELAKLEPKEAERPGVPEGRRLCGLCGKALVPDGTTATARVCQSLDVCFPCFDSPPRLGDGHVAGGAQRGEAEMSRGKQGVPPGRDACHHCGSAPVPDADNSSAHAARVLGLCYRCYQTAEIRRARRAKVGPADHKAGRKPGRNWAGKRPGSPPKLLAAPRSTAGGRKRAVARRSSPPSPVGDLRAEIGAVLKGAFATYAATELRAIAEELEAKIERGDA